MTFIMSMRVILLTTFFDINFPRSKEFEIESISFTIRNKYFSADLLLKAYRSNQHPLFQDALNEAEACILTTSSILDEVIQ
jgi:hypothetical protein